MGIREILASAQQAEIRGDVGEAVRYLERAAEFYRERQLEARAAQMERQMRRLRGEPVEVVFAGEAAKAGPAGPAPAEPPRPERALSPFERGPQPADPAIGAWCSFCCRPGHEVGELVAGPAGAYICASCVELSRGILGAPSAAAAPTIRAQPVARVSFVELPSQRRARERLEARSPRLALVIGPEGAGKTAFLASLGRVQTPQAAGGDAPLVDVRAALDAEGEARLLRWLEEHPAGTLVLAVRGSTPKPVLVLQGEGGTEDVYDTASLHAAAGGQLSERLLALVDAVLPFELPDQAALRALADALLAARQVALPGEAVAQLVELAERSGRGLHELSALVARIPAGSWTR